MRLELLLLLLALFYLSLPPVGKEEEEVKSKGTLPPSTYYTVKEISPKEEEIHEKLF